MYSSKWSITGSAGAQSLSAAAFPHLAPRPAPDEWFPPHVVHCKNTHPTVSAFVGDEFPDGGDLVSYGFELKPGETFQIHLTRDQLWVQVANGQTGELAFIVNGD